MTADLSLIRERAKHLYENTSDSLARICMKLSIEFNIAESTVNKIVTYSGCYYEKNPKFTPLQSRAGAKIGRRRVNEEIDKKRVKQLFAYYRRMHKSESHTKLCARVAIKMNLDRTTIMRIVG